MCFAGYAIWISALGVAATAAYSIQDCRTSCGPKDKDCWSLCQKQLDTSRYIVQPPPPTANNCALDEECGNGFRCQSGTCICPNYLAVRNGVVYCTEETCNRDSDCLPAMRCISKPPKFEGVCEDVSCADSTDCLHNEMCTGGICVKNSCSPKCGPRERCSMGKCQPLVLCGDNRDCQLNEKCIRTHCSPLDIFDQCDETRACTGNEICSHGLCARPCRSHTDCSPTETCSEFTCRPSIQCYGDIDCAPGEICTDSRCTLPCYGVDCPSKCSTTVDCEKGYVCFRGSCQMTCSLELACPEGYRCDHGLCVMGTFCTSYWDCESKICWNRRCVACVLDIDCDDGMRCERNECVSKK